MSESTKDLTPVAFTYLVVEQPKQDHLHADAAWLNFYGGHAWELVSIQNGCYYFKRSSGYVQVYEPDSDDELIA